MIKTFVYLTPISHELLFRKNPIGQQNILNPSTQNTQDAITAFEDDYGKIPDRISCKNVPLHCSSVRSVISPGTRVDDPAINALFGLNASGDTVTFDATSLPLLRRAKHQNTIKSASELLQHQYSNSSLSQLIFILRNCQNDLISLFNGDHSGNGNHWGSASPD